MSSRVRATTDLRSRARALESWDGFTVRGARPTRDLDADPELEDDEDAVSLVDGDEDRLPSSSPSDSSDIDDHPAQSRTQRARSMLKVLLPRLTQQEGASCAQWEPGESTQGRISPACALIHP